MAMSDGTAKDEKPAADGAVPTNRLPGNPLPGDAGPIAVVLPEVQLAPLILASPHSGQQYSDEFLAAAKLDLATLRQSEDCYVDELIAGGPGLGVPVLRALFPRVFVDANREAFELDPAMFEDALPAHANAASPRVAAGLGMIPRYAANDREIYRRKLSYAEAEARIAGFYRPYHRALRDLIRATREKFGLCLLLDCHSMPSVGGAADKDRGRVRVDYVLGDCFGASCADAVTAMAERHFRDGGAHVRRNNPYSGGYITQHYGKPAEGVHVLQIEINRSLYMDERSLHRSEGFDGVKRSINSLIELLKANALDIMRRR